MRFLIALCLGCLVTGGASALEPIHKGQPISYWSKQLLDKSPANRLVAAGEFGQMEPEIAKLGLSELTATLKDPEYQTRLLVAISLERIGTEALPALTALIDALEAKENREGYYLKQQIIAALGNGGAKAKEAVPALIRQLDDEKVRLEACQALGKIGTAAKSALPALGKLIHAKAPPDQLSAASVALARIDPKAANLPQSVRVLVETEYRQKCRTIPTICNSFLYEFPELALRLTIPLLKDESKLLRLQAARVHVFADPKSKDKTLPPLIAALEDKDAEVRAAVINSIHAIDPTQFHLAIPALVKSLGTGHTEASMGVYMLGKDAATAYPLLIRELEGKTLIEQSTLITSLASMYQSGLPLLVAALDNSSLSIRRGAAAAIMSVGGPAVTAIPGLIKLTQETDVEVRLLAVEALAAVDVRGEKLAAWLPTVEVLARTKDVPTQSRAVAILQALGAKAKPVLPTLIAAMDKASGDLRAQMALALFAIDHDQVKRVLPVFLAALSEPGRRPWEQAIVKSLGEIGAKAKEALPLLRKRLVESNDLLAQTKEMTAEMFTALLATMTSIDRKEIATMVPVLTEMLKQRPLRRQQLIAIKALAEWGSEATSAIPKLREQMADKTIDLPTRYAVTCALILLGGDTDHLALESIREVIKSSTMEDERRQLLIALSRLGPCAKPLAVELKPLLKDEEVGSQTKRVLAIIDPKIDRQN